MGDQLQQVVSRPDQGAVVTERIRNDISPSGTTGFGSAGTAVDEDAGRLEYVTDDIMRRQQPVQPQAVTSRLEAADDPDRPQGGQRRECAVTR